LSSALTILANRRNGVIGTARQFDQNASLTIEFRTVVGFDFFGASFNLRFFKRRNYTLRTTRWKTGRPSYRKNTVGVLAATAAQVQQLHLLIVCSLGEIVTGRVISPVAPRRPE
jgi:hypothetical protein